MSNKPMKSVFVTVGTTSFDKLIATVDSPSMKETFRKLGFTHIMCQIGNGVYVPDQSKISTSGLAVDHFRLKSSIANDISEADLVISHAGAGSILETLRHCKPLVVVINDDLMGNHQVQLAKRLGDDGHLLYCNCSSLEDTLQKVGTKSMKPFPDGQPEKFASYLDNALGF